MGKNYNRLLFGVYFAALFLCGIARVMLKWRFLELETGFYTQENGIVLVFNIGLLLAVVTLFAANRLRRVINDYPVYYQSKFSALLAALSGVAILLYTFLDTHYPVMEQNYSETLLKLRDIGAVVLGVVAGLALLWIGLGGLFGRVSGFASLPALFISLWQVYMLITRFNGFTVLTTISDNLLAVLFMVFASLFLIGQARTVFGLSRKDGRNYTIPSGLCASLMGFLLVIPNYLYMLLHRVTMPAPMLGMWESVYVLVLSLYALVFVIGMSKSIKPV